MSNLNRNMLYHGKKHIFLSDFLFFDQKNKTENWVNSTKKVIFYLKLYNLDEKTGEMSYHIGRGKS